MVWAISIASHASPPVYLVDGAGRGLFPTDGGIDPDARRW
jgi:hypothetical protein